MDPIGTEDSGDLYEALVRHESVMRWLATGRAGSRADALDMCQDHAAHWETHGYGDFAVRNLKTSEFLGRVGLRNRPGFGVDLGFAMGPHAEGQGFASEAGRACLDLAFGSLGIATVFGFVLPDNERSAALLTRWGRTRRGPSSPAGIFVCVFSSIHRWVIEGLSLIHPSRNGNLERTVAARPARQWASVPQDPSVASIDRPGGRLADRFAAGSITCDGQSILVAT